LTETDAARQDAVLEAMLRADFAGAVRHVNQLISVRVAGVINCPDPAVNSGTVYIPLDVLQDEAGMMLEGRVTELLIRDKRATPADMTLSTERAPLITAALEAGLADSGGGGLPPELGVFEWKRYAEDYLGYEAMEGGGNMIFIVLLLFLSFLGISNTMLLAILERGKEIGMMRALGMTDGQLVLVYMMEAGFLGLLGSAAGLVIGCLVNIPMVKVGVDMAAMTEAMGASGGYRIASNFRSAWNLPVIIAAPVAATLLASLMAFFPTRRALKPAVSESLRFE
jgi:ABC-type lipoprotein release transport system permease subunit